MRALSGIPMIHARIAVTGFRHPILLPRSILYSVSCHRLDGGPHAEYDRIEADNAAALAVIEPYFVDEPAPDNETGAHFGALLTLIEAGEAKRHPVPPPDPISAIKFRIEQTGLSPRDLEPAIGRLNRVYEALASTRGPSLPLIRRVHAQFGVPLDASIGTSTESHSAHTTRHSRP